MRVFVVFLLIAVVGVYCEAPVKIGGEKKEIGGAKAGGAADGVLKGVGKIGGGDSGDAVDAISKKPLKLTGKLPLNLSKLANLPLSVLQKSLETAQGTLKELILKAIKLKTGGKLSGTKTSGDKKENGKPLQTVGNGVKTLTGTVKTSKSPVANVAKPLSSVTGKAGELLGGSKEKEKKAEDSAKTSKQGGVKGMFEPVGSTLTNMGTGMKTDQSPVSKALKPLSGTVTGAGKATGGDIKLG